MKIHLHLAACFLLLAVFAAPSDAQPIFRSDLYLGANFAAGNYSFASQTGSLHYTKQSVLPTYGYAARLYGKRRPYFLETGVQLRFAESRLANRNTLPGVANAELNWTVRHQGATIPLRIGRWIDLGAQKSMRIEPYAGLSVGLSSVSYVRLQSSLANSGADTIRGEAYETTDLSEHRLLATADIGTTFIPFTRHPKFQLGAELSFNLTATNPATLRVYVANESQGVEQHYGATFTRHYTNAAVMVRYAFGRAWKHSVQRSAMPRVQKEQVTED